jgi:hypothetical protein
VEVVLLPASPQVRALQLGKAKTDPPSPIPLQTRPSEIPSPMQDSGFGGLTLTTATTPTQSRQTHAIMEDEDIVIAGCSQLAAPFG